MNTSAAYNLAFAAVVCVVCALVVTSSNVSLKDLQEANEALEKQLGIMDLTAFCLARDHNKSIRVFNMQMPGALVKAVLEGSVGTLITRD